MYTSSNAHNGRPIHTLSGASPQLALFAASSSLQGHLAPFLVSCSAPDHRLHRVLRAALTPSCQSSRKLFRRSVDSAVAPLCGRPTFCRLMSGWRSAYDHTSVCMSVHGLKSNILIFQRPDPDLDLLRSIHRISSNIVRGH